MKLFRKSSGKKARLRIIVGTLFLALIAGISWTLFHPSESSAAWYNNTWSYRKQLTIDHTKISGGADLTNFPVLVSLTDSNLNAALSTGNDILFTSSDGTTKLSHEIESFTQSTGTLVAWVKIPTLSASTDTKIYLYWGNSGAASQQDATNVWDTNFKGVWHLKETSGTTVADSTGVNNGTKVGASNPSPTTGQINGGQLFVAASSDKIDAGTNTSLNITGQNITFSAWVKRTTSSATGYIMSRGTSGSNGYGFGIGNIASSGCGTNTITASKFGLVHACIGAVPADTSWHQLAVVWNSSGAVAYIDGASSTPTSADTSSIVTSSNNARIGVHPAGTQDYLDGSVDELKISSTNRSAGWIGTEYNNQSSPSTFFSQSKVESKDSPALYWNLDEGTGQTANDRSIYSDNGTFGASTAVSTDDPTWQPEDQCIFGKCAYFDGGDFISGSDKDYFSPVVSDISISLWAKVPIGAAASGDGACGGTGRYMIAKGNTGEFEWGIENDNNTLICATFWQSSGTGHSTRSYAMTVNDGKWHHYEVTYDYLVRSALSIDGKEVSSGTTFTGTMTNGTQVVQVGRRATSNFFIGYLDDIKIYPYARTASQVQSDFASKGAIGGTATSFGASNPLATLGNGLVGYWKMDESTWGTPDCSTAVVLDASGNANNGKACPTTTGPTGAAAGKFANAGSFDGTNDYVLLPTTTSLSAIESTATSWTISTWINPTTLSTNAILYGTDGNNNAQTVGILLNGNGSSTTLFIRSPGCSGGTTSITLSQALTTSAWQLLTITRNNGNVSVYINGSLVGTTTAYTQGCNSVANMVIGGSATWTFGDTQATTYFSGKLDDFRIYNRELSAPEVRSLYDWAPGPLGYWKMDERTGSSANDSSGNAGTGTWNGTLGSQWNTGKYGGSAQFDGSTNYLTTNNGNSVKGASQITVEAWIYPTVLNTGNTIYAECISSSTASNRFKLAVNSSGTVIFQGRSSDGNTLESWATSNSTISINRWWHIVAIFDSVNDVHKIYINGVQDVSNSVTTSSFDTTNPNAVPRIGATNSGTEFFTGKIDDVKIYNYARTQKQIIQDMNAGAPSIGGVGTPGNAIGYWSFDEGYGTTANNKGSGTSINGTLTGSPNWNNSGKFGKAITFSNAGTAQRVKILSASSSSPLDAVTSNSYSFSAWANPASVPSSGTNDHATILGRPGFNEGIFYMDTQKFQFDIYNSSNTRTAVASAATYATGSWHHVVGVVDATLNTMKIYVDGALQGTNTFTGTLKSLTTNPYFVGTTVETTCSTAGTYCFNGSVDEVKIYNYALSEDEVKADYNQGSSQSIGSLSTASNGTTADSSQSRAYCIPGDTATCSAPVAEWNFDERTGTSANDISGNGSTASFTNMVTSPWTVGKKGAALLFNNNNNQLSAGSASVLDDLTTLTASAWIYPTGSGAEGFPVIIGKNQDAVPTSGWYLEIVGSSKALEFGVDYGSTGLNDNLYRDTTSNAVTYNTWQYVTVTWDGTNTLAGVHIYVNGIEASYTGGQTGTGSRVSDAIKNLYIGNDGSQTGDFAGKIDDVKVFNYVRTPAQVAWDYNQGGPIGWWKFDECSGTTANDASGNSNTGTITIGATGTYTSAGSCNSGTSTEAWNSGSTGKFGSSIGLDGTNDYMSVPYNSNFAITSDITLSAWFKKADSGATAYFDPLIAKTNSGDTLEDFNFFLDNAADGNILTFTDDANGFINGVTPIRDTNWHHAVFTRLGTTASIYLDGRLDSTKTFASSFNNRSYNIYVGFDNGTSYFKGQLDAVRIYRYALTSSQIKTLYNENSVVRFGQ